MDWGTAPTHEVIKYIEEKKNKGKFEKQEVEERLNAIRLAKQQNQD